MSDKAQTKKESSRKKNKKTGKGAGAEVAKQQQSTAVNVQPVVSKTDAGKGAAGTDADQKVTVNVVSAKSQSATSTRPSDESTAAKAVVQAVTKQQSDLTIKSDSRKSGTFDMVILKNKVVAPLAAGTPSDRTDKKPVEGAAEKSKSELRAERRAKQEAQRAAKAAGKPAGGGGGGPTSQASLNTGSAAKPAIVRAPETVKAKDEPTSKVSATKITKILSTDRKVLPKKFGKLFSHLPQSGGKISVIQAAKDGIHSAIIRLGLQYAKGVICGSNARCVALIEALLEVIRDFRTPESKEISDALCSMHIDPSMKFLEHCRPVSVGMKNVSKKLREEIVSLPKDLTEAEVKVKLSDMLTTFRQDDILEAHVSIVNFAKEKISSDDVILTYGCSYLVKRVLVEAYKVARFRVIVVDARPKLEGRSMISYLVQQGIPCTYVLISSLSYFIQESTKVILGAHALLANGFVMSRVGSSQVALVAKAHNKPVLVCCETYKFCELVQTDPFVFNELGSPDDLVSTVRPFNPLAEWNDKKYLNILNLYYDVTPPELVTVVINDVNLVPCTSVPVLLRVKPTKK